MKTKLIFSLLFSVILLQKISSQEKKEQESIEKWKYKPNFMVGFDVLNSSIAFFGDRKLFQGFVSSKVKDNTHAVIDAGFEKNVYRKNGYDATVNGPFVKIGAFYMLAKDLENEYNGFYAGGKAAGAFYKQEYFAIPVRGYGGSSASVSMPSSSQSSFWLEGTIGGRVQLFESDFFIDVNMQPRYLLATSKQDSVEPMIVPGFGRSSNSFTVGFSWSLAYKF